MPKYGFNIMWSSEDEGFIVTCPDFPTLSAFGETAEDALTEGQIALDLFLESLQASGDALPKATEATEFSGQTRVRMPKVLHRKLAQQADNHGVSLNTWIVTLLAEQNSVAQFAEEMIKRLTPKMENVEKAIKDHSHQAKVITIQREVAYTSDTKEGGEYGRVEHIALRRA